MVNLMVHFIVDLLVYFSNLMVHLIVNLMVYD